MRRMTGKIAMALAALMATMALSSSAFALDGYEDRDGVFGGFGAGGGLGFTYGEDPLEDGEGPGLNINAVIGGGVSDNVTIGLGADWWIRSVSKGAEDTYTWHNSNIGADVSFFLIDGFHLGGRMGFAYGVCSGTRNGRGCDWQEMGAAAKAGVGYEFFFNGNVAGAVDMDYTHHYYFTAPTSFATANLTFGLRFY